MERAGRRIDLLALLFLVAVVLLYFGPVLFGNARLVTSNMSRWLPWRAAAPVAEIARPSFRDDAAMTYFPRRYFSGEEMKAGRIPLWNPYILCGTPHLADFQSCVFHPLNLLLTFTADPAWAMGAFAAFHLLLGGLFLFLLLRRLGATVAASLLGGVSFLFNAYFVTYLGHPVHISTGCWVPLLLLLVHRGLRGRPALLLPAAVAMTILGGFPQTVLYGFGIAAAFALFQWSGLAAKERRNGLGRLAVVAVLFALGAGLVLFQILPTAELARLSERQVIDLDTITGHHMETPWSLVRLLLPGFYGDPVREDFWLAALKGPLPHPSDLGFIGYGGVAALLLALAAPFLSRRRERWFFAGLAAISLLLAYSPLLFSLYYRLVPFARFSTEVHRLQFPFLLSTAVLAGLGLDAVQRRAARGAQRGVRAYAGAWLITIPLGAAALSLGGPALLRHAASEASAWEARAGRGALAGSLPPGAVGYLSGGGAGPWLRSEWKGFVRYSVLLAVAGGSLLLLAGGGRKRRRTATALLLLSATADGWVFARAFWTPQPAGAVFAPDRALETLRSGDEPFRIARAGREYLLPPNTGLVYGIEDVQGVNALMPRDIGRIFAAVHPALWPDKRRIAPVESWMGDPLRLPLWSLLNVGAFLAPPGRRGAASDGALFEGHENLVPAGERPFRVYENRSVLPRAFLRHRWRVFTDRDSIVRAITSPDFDLEGPLLLEESPSIPEGSAAAVAGDRCRIVHREGAGLTIRTASAEAGLLFASETWYAGWEATVDGAPAQILRADYAFRAVPLAAGTHEVRFRYRPRSFRDGATASAASLAAYALLLLFAALHRRRARAGAGHFAVDRTEDRQ